MRTEYRYGPAIKQLRSDRGWTQEDLAEASGLAARTIQRLEKDIQAGADALKAVAAAFDVTVADLRRAYQVAEAKPLRGLTINQAEDFYESLDRAHHDYIYRIYCGIRPE